MAQRDCDSAASPLDVDALKELGKARGRRTEGTKLRHSGEMEKCVIGHSSNSASQSIGSCVLQCRDV
eukprot:2327380-Rhodomonas_salina.2